MIKVVHFIHGLNMGGAETLVKTTHCSSINRSLRSLYYVTHTKNPLMRNSCKRTILMWSMFAMKCLYIQSRVLLLRWLTTISVIG